MKPVLLMPYYGANFFSNLTFQMFAILTPLMVLQISGSAQVMGYVAAMEYVPNLLLATVLGAWVDRFDRQRLLLLLVFALTLVLMTIALLPTKGQGAVWALMALVFLFGALRYGYQNACTGLVKQTIHADHHTSFMANITLVNSAVSLTSPLLAGAIAYYLLLSQAYLLASLAMGLTLVFVLRLPGTLPTRTADSLWAGIRHAWLALLSQPVLLRLCLLAMVFNTAVTMLEVQMIYVAVKQYGFNSAEVGALIACCGVGALLGAQWVKSINRVEGVAAVLVALMVSFLAYGLMPSTFMLFMISLLVGLAGSVVAVFVWVFRLKLLGEQNMGAMLGLTSLVFKLGMPLGLACSGHLVSQWGFSGLLAVSGMLLLWALVLALSNKEALAQVAA